MRQQLYKLSLAIVLLFVLLTGCSAEPKTETLHQSQTVRVERTGNNTTVYDLVSGTEYSFTSHRTRVKKGDAAAHASKAITAADTETIKLQTVYGLIILEDKTEAQTYYIK